MSHPEQQYLDLLSDILANGDKRIDRTGVGTLAVFGRSARFDVSNGHAPILTTKRVYWKTSVKEMLWFLTGDTNIQSLLKENVRIWTDWPLARYRREIEPTISQSEFEQRIIGDDDFAAKWGSIGPSYGKQWRSWEGPDGQSYDQVAEVVRLLKESPTSRRILFHGWNVPDLSKMALPPCHLLYQYSVTSDGRLSCVLFQRSVDVLLGLPFNWIGTYALLLMLAQQADLQPGELVWMGGDTHLYLNHLDQARLQMERSPRPWPTMRLARKAASIDDYKIEDFVVDGYDPHPPIAADVAV